MSGANGDRLRRTRNGESWLIGVPDDVKWIADSTEGGLAITSAVPPIFAAYATVVVPEDDAARDASDAAVVDALRGEDADGHWWLGYLDTSLTDEIIFRDVPMVTLYARWSYVLIAAGPSQALTWRCNDLTSWQRGALPELMFPDDRAWLVSTLWDDDWRCVGGSQTLVNTLLEDSRCEARAVTLDMDATPPGHQAI